MPVTTAVRSGSEEPTDAQLFVHAHNERDTSLFSYCWQTLHPGE